MSVHLLAAVARLLGMAALGAALCAGALVRAGVVVVFLVRARLLLAGGLRCPRGHVVPTDGERYRCGACGFRYESGSMWLCANPECGAPTPYVNCPTCGLSVPSPYRFLHS